MPCTQIKIKQLSLQPYEKVYEAMQAFTTTRNENTYDEVWFLEHFPVYTLGLAGKKEHILRTSNIPIIQSDRGGQITYHGPGQLMVYVLIDIKRRKLGIRQLVSALEQSVVDLLGSYNIDGAAKKEAPGVYVKGKKIASVGLKIKRYCSYHGISLNVNMDLSPFSDINPCGFENLEMTQLADLGIKHSVDQVQKALLPLLIQQLNSSESSEISHSPINTLKWAKLPK